MIVFNDISRTDIGFDSDYNEVRILTKDSEVLLPRAPKETIAEFILDNVAQAVRARRGETQLPAQFRGDHWLASLVWRDCRLQP